MSYRAKCPSCGRKQPAELSQAGQSIFCAACGARFNVVLTEQADDDTTIPDIDFFPGVMPSPDLPPDLSVSSSEAAAPVKPPVPAPVPHPLPNWPSVPAAPPPLSDGTPQVFRAGPRIPRWIFPAIAGGLLLLGIAVGTGIGIGMTIAANRHSMVVNSAPIPLPSPVRIDQIPPVPSITSDAPAAVAEKPPSTTLSELPAPVEHVPVPTPTEIVPRPPAKFEPVHPVSNGQDLDDRIGKALDRGVNYLLGQFSDGRLARYDPQTPSTAGLDALAVYALLHAGEATHDQRLGPNAPLVGPMLDALKKMPMDHDVSTYSRSLRAAALGVYHRAVDKNALREDCSWLIADSQNGAYTYDPPTAVAGPRRALIRMTGGWDNSNSQYGALGVWAALEAGVEVPRSYWTAVQKHWLSCQLPDGEWGYTGYGAMGRLSMTVAGITTLLVTEDQLDARAVVTTLGHQPYTPALQRGLNWLEAGDNAVRLPSNWRTYNLFGLERAALASGYKYFGEHDWYRELATEQLDLQGADASWTGFDPIVDTSYTLLFLSRGRHPIFMNKLRFDGFWANRPRDIANLSHYASAELERPLNWQVVSFKSDWTDWMDSPVLFIASQEALKLSDDQVSKLRSYVENGGLIFTHADGGSVPFSRSVAELAKRLMPQYALADLPTTHPIYSSLYKVKSTPKLAGISNGARLLLLHSPEDLNKAWQLQDAVEKPVSFQMGMNVFIYAAGKANLRNRLKTPVVPEPTVKPILTTTIAQLRHLGDWNPEPAGLPRFARLFQDNTSVKVNVVDADPETLDPMQIPMVHLTGNGPVRFTVNQLHAIQNYVDNGGTLLIDAFGGSTEFQKSMLLDFCPHAFPKTLLSAMPSDNPILHGTGPGMTPVNLKLRPYSTETSGATVQPLEYFTEGKGTVIYSTVDLSTAYLGTSTWGINGYDPETAYDLTRNILLCILER